MSNPLNPKSAVVIGAGVGGMAAAIRLAVLGYRVTVFEKNDYPGGKLHAFEQDGYLFDAGPSLFTRPALIEELFRLAGEPMEPYFRYRRSPVACRYFFANGRRVSATADTEAFAAEMASQLGEDPLAVTAYLRESARLYENVGSLFLRNSLHRFRHFSAGDISRALRSVRWPHLFGTLNDYNESKFRTAEAAQLFNRYATYNGSNPYAAPAMLSLIPHLEMNEGTFYPEGGMISITRALHRLAERVGVQFVFGTGVTRILRQAGRVTGIAAGSDIHEAGIVVSNMDVYYTYRKLLQDEAGAAKLLKQERSSSALIYYWGIGREFDELHLHNILFSADYRREFGHIFSGNDVYEDPTVYINITSKMEPGLAPPGRENWFVMVNVPANRGQDWPALTQQVRGRVIEKVNRMLQTDLESLIETEATLDPVRIERQSASYMGSLYGTSSNSRLAAFWRHPNHARRVAGLYFVGGSVHPGGGIPLCLSSAAIMARMVREDFGPA